MELIHTALLLNKAGKEVNESNVKKVLDAVGIKEDEGKIKALVTALENVNIEEVVKEASAMPVAVQAAPQEARKEEKKEEKKPADDTAAVGLGSLFG
ncbi:MAG: 50S ribosomal protein P1 [Nanoarchaeota archaeon]